MSQDLGRIEHPGGSGSTIPSFPILSQTLLHLEYRTHGINDTAC